MSTTQQHPPTSLLRKEYFSLCLKKADDSKNTLTGHIHSYFYELMSKTDDEAEIQKEILSSVLFAACFAQYLQEDGYLYALSWESSTEWMAYERMIFICNELLNLDELKADELADEFKVISSCLGWLSAMSAETYTANLLSIVEQSKIAETNSKMV